jgi:purine nucleosidase
MPQRSHRASQVRHSVVIDCDPGCDDLAALALALRSPELHVRAITTSYGTASLADTTRNAASLLNLMGWHPPLIPGADRPLRRRAVPSPEAHGPTGAGAAAVGPAAPVRASQAALLDALRVAGEPVSLVTLGPMTNLAHALAGDRALVREMVHRQVAVFGAFTERGAPDRLADFNAWADPEALADVLRAGLDITAIPLDVSRRVVTPRARIDDLAASADPVQQWLGAAFRPYADHAQRIRGTDGCSFHDALAVAAVVHPGLLSTRHLPLSVDLDDGPTRGHTRVDSAAPALAVAVEIDVPAAHRLLDRLFDPADSLGSENP